MTLTCTECEQNFSIAEDHRGVRPVTCSPDCRRARRNRLYQTKQELKRAQGQGALQDELFTVLVEDAPKTLVCRECGTEFPKPAYATTKDSKFCSEECRAICRTAQIRERNAQAAAEIAAGTKVRVYRTPAEGHQEALRPEFLTCLECGEEFPRGDSRKPPLTCGEECKKNRKASQRHERASERRAIKTAERAQWALDNPPPPPPGPPIVTCTECGEDFAVEREGNQAGALPMTCSDRCRKDRLNRRARARAVELPNCEVDGCENGRWTPGIPWCTLHYNRFKAYGDPLAEPVRRKANGSCHRCGGPAPETHLFCSAVCRREDGRLRTSGGPFAECATCGKPNEGPPSEKFCGDDCYNFFLRARKYGVSVAELKDLFSEGGRCAICHKPDADHVDHDHETGRVRGLLCGQCNVGLGMFQDSGELLANAIRYLQKGTVSISGSETLEIPQLAS